MTTILSEIFRHSLWANLRTLDACALLDATQLETGAVGTYGALSRTLLHLASAEGSYVRWATGVSIAEWVDDDATFPGLSAIRISLTASGQQLISFAESEYQDRLVTYQSAGRPSTNPLSMILTKALAHATEHRTHVAASLTQLGIEPPELDAWFFVHPDQTPG